MDTFGRVFSQEVREGLSRLAKAKCSDEHLNLINKYLNLDAPNFVNWRIHLCAWLEFCEKNDGLDKDRLTRLCKFDSWWAWCSVLNELSIPFFLNRVYGMSITYPQNGCDIIAEKDSRTLHVEIKTPGQEPIEKPKGPRFLGKDTYSITQNLTSANRQFKKGNLNVLAIGAQCLERCPVDDDLCLINALYGQEKLTISNDSDKGQLDMNTAQSRFFRDGKLQHNRFTRIGSVLVFNDGYFLASKKRCAAGHQYHCAMYHNPYAEQPIPCNMFRGTAQFLFDEKGMSYWKWPEGKTYTFRGY